MAGLANSYIEFKPRDFCYIVVYTPMANQEVVEFLEGMVTEAHHAPKNIPHDHPIWRYYQEPPQKVRSIRAIVTDSRANLHSPKDPIRCYQEPGRHYLVVQPQECARYLTKVVEMQQQRISTLEGMLQRK
ncbi:MAG: hypothetical protein AABX31_05810 [Nanoarchaeota archaeon]